MLDNDATRFDADAIAKLLQTTLSASEISEIARSSGWQRRLRDVAPLAMLVACISTLGTGNASWLADILRTFNAVTGKSLQYKPFHNQLKKKAFPEFVRLVLNRVLWKLTMPVLRSLPREKLTMFRDILLHDGSSFALKDSLATEWPGRFRKISPAAVELHVTMSALIDNPIGITLAPDKDAERAYSPRPEEIKGCLLIEDRGYQDRKFFRDTQAAGGYFLVRGTKNIKPIIRAAYDLTGRRISALEGKRLSWDMLPTETVDMDIDWTDKANRYQGRLVAIYKAGTRNQKTFTYLHTNLLRDVFSVHDVGQLYRLRWQVELLFKEWKSFANLHRFDTSKAPIAEGLIWASLLAATFKRVITHAAERTRRVELSTQRAAKAARHFLDAVLKCLLRGGKGMSAVLREVFSYLIENARRAHPARDRKTGRLSAGLRPIASP